MFAINRLRISTAILAQLLGLGFLMMSLSLFTGQSEFASQQEKSAYLFAFGLWLIYGFGAMFVSWIATLSLSRSVYRGQVQTLCCSGIAISSALLSLSCTN